MWLHRFGVIFLSIMSGRTSMRYVYYRICFGICRGCDALVAICSTASHIDSRHFVIIECRHLAKGCALKFGCIGLMLFRNLACMGPVNTIGFVPVYACKVCDALVASCATTD